MPINWFTVFCEAINFMFLMWLLKRFLYKPILDAIDEREKAIAAQLADAEAKKSEAKQERDEFERKNAEFDKDRAELVKHATDDANSARQRLLEEARKDADLLRLRFQESLKTEQSHLNEEIVRWTQVQVIATARKALADLASASLEERMSEVFLQRLRESNAENREQMAAALKRSDAPVRVLSAYNLSPAQKNAVEKAINDLFATVVPIQFEIVPELVSGIELVMDGQKVAWSITDYLTTLEKSLGHLLHDDPTVNFKLEPTIEPEHACELMTSTAKVNH